VSDVIAPIFGFAGLFAGMLLWVQFMRWLMLLYVSGSKHGGDFLGPPKRRLLWAISALTMLARWRRLRNSQASRGAQLSS
jgi:hypothetical protein